MKRKITYLLVAMALAITVSAMNIIVTWLPNPPDEQVSSYQVYWSTNILGPFTLMTATTNLNVTTNLAPGRYFFYVTASNFWSESDPSLTVSTPPPGTKVQSVRITK